MLFSEQLFFRVNDYEVDDVNLFLTIFLTSPLAHRRDPRREAAREAPQGPASGAFSLLSLQVLEGP